MSSNDQKSRDASNGTRGSLFLVGGKDGRNEDRILIDHFARLCGGKSARVLVITSASNMPDLQRREYREAFRKSGVRDVSIFHANNRSASDDPELLSLLDRVDGVYFSGGGQRRLITVMGGGTRFEERLRERHHDGLHVGGTSAGASAMSQVMITQGRARKPIQPSSVELATGFGLLPKIIVDQHFQQRQRFDRLIAAVLLNPEMLGFGLDEGTAIEIDASGRGEVFGKGALAIVDGAGLIGAKLISSNENERPLAFTGMELHVLTEGWTYDLTTREARRAT
jgi:cyanophycinase